MRTNLRGYDAATGRWLWAFSGSSDLHGLALAGDDAIYMLKPSGSKGLITRIDPATGKVARWGDRESGLFAFEGGADCRGAGRAGRPALRGRRQGQRPPLGADRVAGARSDHPRGRTDEPDGRSRDRAALGDQQGKPAPGSRPRRQGRGRRRPGGGPRGPGGPRRPARRRLAATGKVHFFDAHDPKALEPQGTLGTGDGPFGPYQPDRFLFQRRPAAGEPGCDVTLALGPDGALAVTDENRLLVFDRHGKSLWTTFGLFGDACVLSFADRSRLFTADGRKSLRLVEGSGTWSPDAYWDVPRGAFLGCVRRRRQDLRRLCHRHR